MLTSKFLFVGFVILTLIAALLWSFKSPERLKQFLASKEGKSIVWGIVLFIGIGVGVVAFAEDNKTGVNYLQWGEVFLGLDQTKNESPMCEFGNSRDRLTSNGGFRLNLIESKDKLFTFNGKYTHHSCAFNEDADSYDAIGVEVTYRRNFFD